LNLIPLSMRYSFQNRICAPQTALGNIQKQKRAGLQLIVLYAVQYFMFILVFEEKVSINKVNKHDRWSYAAVYKQTEEESCRLSCQCISRRNKSDVIPNNARFLKHLHKYVPQLFLYITKDIGNLEIPNPNQSLVWQSSGRKIGMRICVISDLILIWMVYSMLL